MIVYAAGANGNAAPIAATIVGPKTGLIVPGGIGVDAAEAEVYVANNGGPTFNVLVFAAGANGDVSPIATIRGSHTGFTTHNLDGLAVTPAEARCTSQTEMASAFLPPEQTVTSPRWQVPDPKPRLTQSPFSLHWAKRTHESGVRSWRTPRRPHPDRSGRGLRCGRNRECDSVGDLSSTQIPIVGTGRVVSFVDRCAPAKASRERSGLHAFPIAVWIGWRGCTQRIFQRLRHKWRK